MHDLSISRDYSYLHTGLGLLAFTAEQLSVILTYYFVYFLIESKLAMLGSTFVPDRHIRTILNQKVCLSLYKLYSF